jgi:hypothetical protein
LQAIALNLLTNSMPHFPSMDRNIPAEFKAQPHSPLGDFQDSDLQDMFITPGGITKGD